MLDSSVVPAVFPATRNSIPKFASATRVRLGVVDGAIELILAVGTDVGGRGQAAGATDVGGRIVDPANEGMAEGTTVGVCKKTGCTGCTTGFSEGCMDGVAEGVAVGRSVGDGEGAGVSSSFMSMRGRSGDCFGYTEPRSGTAQQHVLNSKRRHMIIVVLNIIACNFGFGAANDILPFSLFEQRRYRFTEFLQQ